MWTSFLPGCSKEEAWSCRYAGSSHRACCRFGVALWTPLLTVLTLWHFIYRERAKEQFCFYSFLVQGKASHNNICTFSFGFAKNWLFFSGKGGYILLEGNHSNSGPFLSVTQSILNLISLGICCGPWPQTEFLCLAVHEMSTFIREQALREM